MVRIVYVGYGLRKSMYDAIQYIRESFVHDLDFRFYNVSSIDRGLIEPGKYINDLKMGDIILLDIRGGDNVFKYIVQGVKDSRAKAIIVLVGGSSDLIKLTRLGKFTMRSFEDSRFRKFFRSEALDYGAIIRIRNMFEKIGKYLPIGVLRDARNYVLVLKYYENMTFKNMVNMFMLLLKEYIDPSIDYNVEEPDTMPSMGILDFHTQSIYNSLRDYIDNYVYRDRRLIGILFYGGHHYDESVIAAKALAEYLEDKGYGIVPVFSSDLRYYRAIKKFFILDNKPIIDVLIDLLWFRFAGGPLGGDHRHTFTVLKMLNVPILHGIQMSIYTIDEWMEKNSVSPIETITTVILPELDGRIEPIVTHGRKVIELNDYLVDDYVVLEDRVKKIAERAIKWSSLKAKPNSDKKIAIILYAYPPGEENLGKCAYLDVFASLERLLDRMKEEGYSIPYVPSQNDLKYSLLKMYMVASGKAKDVNRHNSIKLDLGKYREFFNELPTEVRREVIREWGDPKDLGDYIVIPGIELGNIFIGIQPSRGYHEDPGKIYHSRSLPPTHHYIAFYKWIEKIFGADAVIHLGTHGTLEFMPGKEVGLTSKCYPDILIGNLPNIYVYHVTNPSEASIAKRRSYALIIDHASPPLMHGKVPDEISYLENLLAQYYDTLQFDKDKASEIGKKIIEKAQEYGLGRSIDEIHDKIQEYKVALMPKGLHVLGNKMRGEDVINYLLYVSRYDRGTIKSLYRLVAEAEGIDYDEILSNKQPNKSKLYEFIEFKARKIIEKHIFQGQGISKVINDLDLEKIDRRELENTLNYLKKIRDNIESSDEIGSILSALEGEYILPGSGGDPVRTPEIYPTGRNMYQLDPTNIPTEIAWKRGEEIAEKIIREYYEKYGAYPRVVSVVLWAFETMKTGGETIAMIFRLLGVKPVWKTPYIRDIEVIPLKDLGRPRIDVSINICGIFRDTFYNLIELIDKAIKLVSNLDEPLESNYVKANTLYLSKKNPGIEPTIRIFGPPPDKYATSLTTMIETSSWRDESELIKAYIENMRYAYGENVHGVNAQESFMELSRLSDIVLQIRDSVDYEITDLDHYYEFLGGLSRTITELKNKKPEILVADTTRERIKIETIEESIRRGVITRLLNPVWINEMLKHDHHGGEKIASRVEYLLGFAATTHAVDNWIWDKVAEKLVFNEDNMNKIMNNNPWAFKKMIHRLLEAYERGYWKTSSEVINRL
ncbi:MAG: magnesium chelatase subunit H, partial [Thermoprotei archaeon]